MSVAIQYAAGPSLQREHVTKLAVRADNENITLGAAANDTTTGLEMVGRDEALFYVLTSDATAGQLTIVLEHSDSQAGSYTVVDENALILGGEGVTGVPAASLVLDMSAAANQGSILIGVSPAGRETSSGTLVSQLRLSLRLDLTTDGSWDGTEVDVVTISNVRAHYPGPFAG